MNMKRRMGRGADVLALITSLLALVFLFFLAFYSVGGAARDVAVGV